MGTPSPDATTVVVDLAGVTALVEAHVPAAIGREVERRVAAGLALVLSLEDRLARPDVPAELEVELLDRHRRIVAKVAGS